MFDRKSLMFCHLVTSNIAYLICFSVTGKPFGSWRIVMIIRDSQNPHRNNLKISSNSLNRLAFVKVTADQ